LAIQQDSSQFDELSGGIQANRAKIGDLLMKYGAIATGEATSRVDTLRQLVSDYLAVQEKILKTGEDMKALPLGPASSLQRTAFSSQAIALLRERLDPRLVVLVRMHQLARCSESPVVSLIAVPPACRPMANGYARGRQAASSNSTRRGGR
jgi:hypothetical protein